MARERERERERVCALLQQLEFWCLDIYIYYIYTYIYVYIVTTYMTQRRHFERLPKHLQKLSYIIKMRYFWKTLHSPKTKYHKRYIKTKLTTVLNGNQDNVRMAWKFAWDLKSHAKPNSAWDFDRKALRFGVGSRIPCQIPCQIEFRVGSQKWRGIWRGIWVLAWDLAWDFNFGVGFGVGFLHWRGKRKSHAEIRRGRPSGSLLTRIRSRVCFYVLSASGARYRSTDAYPFPTVFLRTFSFWGGISLLTRIPSRLCFYILSASGAV